MRCIKCDSHQVMKEKNKLLFSIFLYMILTALSFVGFSYSSYLTWLSIHSQVLDFESLLIIDGCIAFSLMTCSYLHCRCLEKLEEAKQ